MTHRVLQSKCEAYGFPCDLVLADNAEASMLSQVFLFLPLPYIILEIYVHTYIHTHTHARGCLNFQGLKHAYLYKHVY
jgi:hypothetical protein